MNALLVTASVAPLMSGPSLRSEMVSQLVLGEAAVIEDIQGDMLHVRTVIDDYAGWIAAGYVVRLTRAEVDAWLTTAGWSEGAVATTADGVAIRLPHRARARLLTDGELQLPDGTRCVIYAGTVRPRDIVIADARCQPAPAWAWEQFAGTPYLWGGITGAGIDCSGLVQTTMLARGVTLPRDASQQSAHGEVVAVGAQRPGDLLFFRSRDADRIGHVGWLDADEMLVHSTIDTGAVTRESLAPEARAHDLLARLVAVRRIP